MQKQRWYTAPKIREKRSVSVKEFTKKHPDIVMLAFIDIILGIALCVITLGES